LFHGPVDDGQKHGFHSSFGQFQHDLQQQKIMEQAASPLELIVVPQNGSSKKNKNQKKGKAFPHNN